MSLDWNIFIKDVKDHVERFFFQYDFSKEKRKNASGVKSDQLYSLSEVVLNKKRSNLFSEMEKK